MPHFHPVMSHARLVYREEPFSLPEYVMLPFSFGFLHLYNEKVCHCEDIHLRQILQKDLRLQKQKLFFHYNKETEMEKKLLFSLLPGIVCAYENVFDEDRNLFRYHSRVSLMVYHAKSRYRFGFFVVLDNQQL